MLIYNDLTDEEIEKIKANAGERVSDVLSCGRTTNGSIYYYLMEDERLYNDWHGDAGVSYHEIPE